METITFSLLDIDKVAETLLERLRAVSKQGGATVIALSGELGAGKTTLVQAVARKLGVTTVLPSPTFTIMRSYALAEGRFSRLVHMDAYRIEDETELSPLRFFDYVADSKTLVCVEWPEKIPTALPPGTLFVSLTYGEDEMSRTLEIKY